MALEGLGEKTKEGVLTQYNWREHPYLKSQGKDVFTGLVKSRLHIKAPFTEQFTVKAVSLDGRWKKRSRVWSFPRYRFRDVAQALNEIYGTSIKYHSAEGKE